MLEPASQAEGVNANQVFLWRRAFRNGELLPGSPLLPVVIGTETGVPAITLAREETEAAPEQSVPAPLSGAIHIELPGQVTISVERGADRALLRTILESLQR